MRHEVLSGRPIVRADLARRGLRVNTLSEMTARGVLYRVSRGVYASCVGAESGLLDYELASRVVPKGVFTLLSALRLHDLTDENPQKMSMAISLKSHPPKTTLAMDFVYMKPELLATDVVEMDSNGTTLHVFTVERTIAECFKHRNRIGISVAVSALHDATEKGILDLARLGRTLMECRMFRIAQPYLERIA